MPLGNLKGDMSEPAALEMVADGRVGDIRSVVGRAEVGQPDGAWRPIAAGHQRLGRRIVREVAMLPDDAALQKGWIRPGAQHLKVMIRLKDHQIGVQKLALDVRWDEAQI